MRWVLGVVTCVTVALCVYGPARAGTTGSIAGTVRDAGTGEPVGLANVSVVELKRGAVTDPEGNFFILNLPPGHYTVRVNLLGYVPQVREQVDVIQDFVTRMDVALQSTVLQNVQEVVVRAERPLIQKDVTASTRFVTGDEIKNQPIRGYQDAVAQQAGVVSFNLNNLNRVSGAQTEIQNNNSLVIRGGRPHEVAYYVDGFSQQDPLTGFSTTSIAAEAIDEVVIQAGGYNAEYGRVNSAIVNVVTREGEDRYAGTLEGIYGDFYTKDQGNKILSAALGGPIPLGSGQGKMTFYLSAERRDQEDRKPSYITDQLGDPDQPDLFTDGVLPRNDSESWASAGKLAIKPSPLQTLRLAGTYNKDEWSQYLNTYRYNLPHSPRYEDTNWSLSGAWSHSLSDRTFYELKANTFETERLLGDGVHFDDLKKYYRDPNPQYSDDALFWLGDDPATPADEAHVYAGLLHRKSSYYGLAGNYTSQVSTTLQLKFGADYQRHTLRYFNHYSTESAYDANGNPDNVKDVDHYGYDAVGNEVDGGDTFTDVNGNGTRDSGEPYQDSNGNGIYDDPLDGPKHPKVASAYLQGKYEKLGVVLNAGLRWDYLTPSTKALVSESYPLGPEYGDSLNDPSALGPQDLEDSKVYNRLSPRLGVGFPVSDQTLIHVNYGKFFQQPNLQDLYVSYAFLEHKVNIGGYFVGFGNPNLKPEETTAYEFGITHTPTERSRIEIAAYYKDVKNLVEITTIRSSPNAFSSYRTRDFATIKGLDLTYTLRRAHHFAMNASYSLSWANGTGSISQSQRMIAWQSQEPPKLATPLSFDQRHKFGMNLDYRLGNGEGPAWGKAHPLENAGVNVLVSAASGTPYTPTKVYNAVSLAAQFPTPIGEINSRYGPWTASVDLKGGKTFMLGRQGLEVYLWVMNVFDQKNTTFVYTTSGSAETTNYLNSDAGQKYLADNGPDTERRYRLATLNPDFYLNPRLWRFGAKLSF
jgi:outer membrane receptor protein involved in Fe transport